MPAMVHLMRLGYKYYGKINESQAGSVFDADTNILLNEFKSQVDGNQKTVLSNEEIARIEEVFINEKIEDDFSVKVSYEEIAGKN